MSQLNDVLGALLRDIAQARVTSDLFSRQISELYEQDALLRLFPVPRTEIQEVELDLRFAVAAMSADPQNPAELAARVSSAYGRFADVLPSTVLGTLREHTELKGSPEWQKLLQRVDADGALLGLGRRTREAFEAATARLVSVTTNTRGTSATLDQKLALALVQELMQSLLYARADLTAFAQGAKSAVAAAKRGVTTALKEHLAVLAAAIKAITWMDQVGIDVDVTADKLQTLPEAALAVVRVKAGVRNYSWSQVEEKDNTVVRRLVPD